MKHRIKYAKPSIGDGLMRIAFVLLCLVIFSVYMMGGLLAKYAASGSGEDDARVAVFNVTEVDGKTSFSKELVIGLTPGTILEEIEVVNDSEVAVRYTITVTNETGNIPLEFQVGDSEVTKTTATGSWDMSADSTQKCRLKIVWDSVGAEAYMGMVDKINITLTAEQID